MKLFPPDPEIVLYKTGFGAEDPFNRKGVGKSLSDLVERIEDPLVIALDGGWDSGKTWFLKRWVGEHKLENGGRATTVYFDAFAHDFMDDPLIALTGVIGDQLPKRAENKVWNKVKTAAATLAKPFARIGLAVATGGVTEVAGPIIDAAAQAASREVEAAADAFWAREDGKRAAMQQLRAALVELTSIGLEEGSCPVPLVVVVDELDRCRPDYALAVLEIIKHFFSVPNIHFVLGVNLEALGHSVRARYGAGINAEHYLRRFVSISIRLPDQINYHNAKPLIADYFSEMASAMGIDADVARNLDAHIQLFCRTNVLTMRDVNQILSRIAIIDPEVFHLRERGRAEILSSLILFNFAASDLEKKALDGTLTTEDVRTFYGIKSEEISRPTPYSFNSDARRIADLWGIVITGDAENEENRNRLLQSFDPFGSTDLKEVPRFIYNKYLERLHILTV